MSVNKYDKVNKTLIPIAKNTMQTSPQAIDEAVARVAQSKQDKIQFVVMPTASAENLGKVYQYIGDTTATYTSGVFYKCVYDGSTYEWSETSAGEIEKITSSQVADMWGGTYTHTADAYLADEVADDLVAEVKDRLDGKADKDDIPKKTSELENDSDFVSDADYVHTDNNYTATEKEKLSKIESEAEKNTIKAIKVNGVEIAPDADKTVLIEALTKSVDDLENYYKKSETYDKDEVDAIVSTIVSGGFEAVDALPTTNIKTNVIYLVPGTEPKTQNTKDEYINLDGTTDGWEKIGSTELNLDGYVTETELTTALADKVSGSGMSLSVDSDGYLKLTYDDGD